MYVERLPVQIFVDGLRTRGGEVVVTDLAGGRVLSQACWGATKITESWL